MTTLFDPIIDTRTQAGHRAAAKTLLRWRQILALLNQRPMTCGEIADTLGLSDNVISGRFGADDPGSLRYNGYAERAEETRKVGGRGAADVWRVTEQGREWMRKEGGR